MTVEAFALSTCPPRMFPFASATSLIRPADVRSTTARSTSFICTTYVRTASPCCSRACASARLARPGGRAVAHGPVDVVHLHDVRAHRVAMLLARLRLRQPDVPHL